MTPAERREQVDDWLKRNFLQMAMTLVAIGVAWATMTASISQVDTRVSAKADRVDIERLNYKLDALLRLSCKSNPGDSVCQH